MAASALTIKQIADSPQHPNRAVAGKYLEEGGDSLQMLLPLLDCLRKAAEPNYQPVEACCWKRGAPAPAPSPASSFSSFSSAASEESLETELERELLRAVERED
jgi:hypothetical protein